MRAMRTVALPASVKVRVQALVLVLLRVLALALVSGCLTHVPPTSKKHLEIHWHPTFEGTATAARASGRPMLLVMAAGERDGLC